MQYDKLLNEEKRKISTLIKHQYIPLDFSCLKFILDNNMNEPLWMDVYIMIYEAKLPPCIDIYNILLEKLSKPLSKFYYKNSDGERYIAEVNEQMIKRYVRYLITNEKIMYQTKTQYIPNKEYINELLKYNKFRDCGIHLKHIEKDEFELEPMNRKITNVKESKEIYEKLFDAYDLYKNIGLLKENFIDNIETCMELGKDKKMIATLSIILNCFDCKFIVKDDCITIENTLIQINDEETACSFQEHLLDTYQFYRNVVNTENKRDIVSEIYNKLVDKKIMKQFNDEMYKYLNIVENKELIDWIITISKESKYTLDIKFDEQGVFYIENDIIVTPLEAKEFYISYMDSKKEKLSMIIYSNTILSRIKKVWNIFRAKFARR